MSPGNSSLSARLFAAAFLAATPASAPAAAWHTVAEAPGRRVEIDRDSVQRADTRRIVRSRIVLDRPIVDPRTSASYRSIEIESSYDCAGRTHATLRRTYYREDDSVLRQEEVRNPVEMPVRSGTPDDRILRELCRPRGDGAALTIDQALGKVNEATADLRKANESMVDEAVRKDLRQLNQILAGGKTPASPKAAARDWAYEGAAGPAHWGSLSPDFALCASGVRQSPIDIVDAFAVDLPPIRFLYPPAPFRVADTGRYLELAVQDGSIELLGKSYRLDRVRFHNPSEFSVAGKTYEMEAQLVHRAEDGKQAVVSVLFGQGAENPVVQTALNHLPLERGSEAAPPGLTVDLAPLLPQQQGYFTFMGSLTAPPCTEDVLWMVLKTPQEVSAGQLAMFRRLYPPNARPAQALSGRIIKESRQ
ncbi:MAG: carbonic anhydrase family protein [Candidatus Accumulibacter sp.]|jgi:carbonic anhydrase|nr:carbonic anhydrase family protein [Accumulibacter sp.]